MKKIISCVLAAFFITACGVPTNSVQGSTTQVLNVPKVERVDKIALLIPQQTIKSYSNVIINSSLAYLARQNSKLKMKVFLIQNEQDAKLQKALNDLKAENFRFVIAGLTLKGANYLAMHAPKDLMIYIPTLHKNSTDIRAENIYFGGIDYEMQIKTLLEQGNSNVAVFYDDSALSSNLEEKLSTITQNRLRKYRVEGKKINFSTLLKSNGSLDNANIFLNTPLVKTSIIASQIRANEIYPNAILLTQIGYNPTLLRLTQPEDRRKFIIANSILNEDEALAYTHEIFEQSLDYNWVAYSTSVGLDYFYAKLEGKNDRIFKETMKDNQILYKIKLMKSLGANFQAF